MRKPRLVISVLFLGSAAIAIACGLDVVGTFVPNADADGSAPDGSVGPNDDAAGSEDASIDRKQTCSWPSLQKNAAWPMIGGCVTHAGRTELRGPHAKPELVWKASVQTNDPVPVIDVKGNVYVPNNNGKIEVFGPDGGGRRTLDFGSGDLTSTPAIGSDGTIYVGISFNPLALTIDGGMGKIGTTGGIDSSPVLDKDGNVYLGSDTRKLASFSPAGIQRWELLTGGTINSSPAIGPLTNDIYVGSQDHHLYAVNPADGGALWRYDAGAQIESSPVVADDGTIYVGTDTSPGKLHAVTRAGAVKWIFVAPGPFVWQLIPAIGWNGVIYAPSGNKLTALSPEDGGVLFTYTAQGTLQAPAIVDADGIVYVAGDNHRVAAISPDGGMLWEFETEQDVHGMAIGRDGMLYVTSTNDAIYALHEP